MVAVTEDERPVRGDVSNRRRALRPEELGEQVERVLLVGPPPRHMRGPEIEIAWCSPPDLVEDDPDQSPSALPLVQTGRDARATEQRQVVQAGDVRGEAPTAGVDLERVDPAHHQRVEGVVDDLFHFDRRGGRDVLADRAVRVLRRERAVRVAQAEPDGAYAWR